MISPVAEPLEIDLQMAFTVVAPLAEVHLRLITPAAVMLKVMAYWLSPEVNTVPLLARSATAEKVEEVPATVDGLVIVNLKFFVSIVLTEVEVTPGN